MAAKYYRGLVFCEPSLLYIPIADFVFPLSTTRVFPLSSRRRRPDYAAAVQSTMAQGRMHALATVLALYRVHKKTNAKKNGFSRRTAHEHDLI